MSERSAAFVLAIPGTTPMLVGQPISIKAFRNTSEVFLREPRDSWRSKDDTEVGEVHLKSHK